MEVIYRDNGKLNLPKNVKQIGTKEGKRIVYIEDYAYSFIRDISVDEDDDGAVGILLGEIKKSGGVTYMFVKGVVEVLNAAVYTDHIAFTQETWPIINKYIAQYFSDYSILGWYLSSSKILEDNMDVINKADQQSFSDEDNVFFMVNSSTGDEAFFQKSEDGLVPMSGYTVYFEKNPSMQRYMKENQSEYDAKYVAKPNKEEPEEKAEEADKGEYRKIIKDAKPNNGGSIKRNLTAIYVLSMLVIIVVLIIGVNKINEFGKSSAGGNGESTLEANGDAIKPSKTPVTSLDANVPSKEDSTTEAPTEEATTEDATTEAPTEEPTTEEPTTEAPTKEDVIYVVKSGDGLYRICIEVYGKWDEALANNILSYNGITVNQLQPGLELKIPSV